MAEGSCTLTVDLLWHSITSDNLGVGEFADIFCADAWYGDAKGYPTFVESAGRSLLLERTAQGTTLLNDAAHAGILQSEVLKVAQVERIQPYQATRKRALLARLLGFRLAFKATPSFANMRLREAAKTMSLKLHAKNALGTWLRVSGLKK